MVVGQPRSIACDGCEKKDIRGRLYKCLVCYKHILCDDCYKADVTTADHLFDHPVLCEETNADGTHDSLQIFRCPYCKLWSQSLKYFEQHIQATHPDANEKLISALKLTLLK